VDKNILILLIPVLALATGLIAVLKMPRKAFAPRRNSELETRVQALEQEAGALRHELSEIQERLDFAERILAKSDEARQIGKS